MILPTPPSWFKKRAYKHFDLPVKANRACELVEEAYVKKHSFLPLLRYIKSVKRYKYNSETRQRTITYKKRPIAYSSHRDACILSCYAEKLHSKLEGKYKDSGISDCVIAYRKLKKANYDFAAEAFSFARDNSPVKIIAFDVKGFFENLSHPKLKEKLKSLLDQKSLSDDWYKVFRYITKYHYIDINHIRENKNLTRRNGMIASIAEVKAEGITFNPNPNGNKGIPQGTPISAVLSNLYMLDFDKEVYQLC